MSCFNTWMQKATCAAADPSAAAGFACGSFRITMDAVLCAVSIFAILVHLVAAGILVSVVGIVVLVAVWLLILGIGVATRSATAHCAS